MTLSQLNCTMLLQKLNTYFCTTTFMFTIYSTLILRILILASFHLWLRVLHVEFEKNYLFTQLNNRKCLTLFYNPWNFFIIHETFFFYVWLCVILTCVWALLTQLLKVHRMECGVLPHFLSQVGPRCIFRGRTAQCLPALYKEKKKN